MTIIQAIVLGIIQGVTEFLPISSSGHLVIANYLFGWTIPDQVNFVFDIIIHLGSLLALVVFFRKDLYQLILIMYDGVVHRRPFANPISRLGWFLILATIPAVLVGIFFKNIVEKAFTSPVLVAVLLLVTAVLLVVGEWYGKRLRNLENLTWQDALIVGAFQALALFPGISRSGATISAGMMRNLDRGSAARFAFLMSVPIMVGVGGLGVLDLVRSPTPSGQILTLLLGFIFAAITGFMAIRWLLAYVSRRPLYLFAIYCTGLSIFVILLSVFRA